MHIIANETSLSRAASESDTARSQLIGQAPAFLSVVSKIGLFARSDAPLLIEGETGSGKEVVARAIHAAGARRASPFVAINCGALPDHLLEAELFGHERGAFTDAKCSREGLVAEADGGTLFLDEVDTLSPKAQVALLRFLQDWRYRRLGDARERRSDVRLMAASNRCLEQAVTQGVLRSDLFYRLKILHLELPPLRDRPGDPELLAKHFVEQLSARYDMPRRPLHPQTLSWVGAQPWLGNVRELENWVHRQLLMSEGPSIGLAPEPARLDCIGSAPADLGNFTRAKAEAIRRFERDFLLRALHHAGGNVTSAAQLVGKERRAFGKLLKKHGIDRALPQLSICPSAD